LNNGWGTSKDNSNEPRAPKELKVIRWQMRTKQRRRVLQIIAKEISYIAGRMRREDECEDIKNDWRFASMVVDRCCLILFSAFLVISSCWILLSAPNFWFSLTKT
jgi:hypothetical protein